MDPFVAEIWIEGALPVVHVVCRSTTQASTFRPKLLSDAWLTGEWQENPWVIGEIEKEYPLQTDKINLVSTEIA